MRSINALFRYLLLLGVPFLLGILEIWHPIGFKNDVFNQLLPQVDWWINLHLLQIPLFALIGTGIYVLIARIRSLPAVISRVAIWLFVVYYIAFDSVNGIGTGVLIQNASELSPAEQAPIAHAAQQFYNDPFFGGTHSWMSEFASLAWLIAIWSAAWALYLRGRPVIPLVFLLLSGVFLWNSHAYPYGPLGFSCLFIANAWLEFSRLQVLAQMTEEIHPSLALGHQES